jgi:4a-hydroxytetrahydrobiopterin dehydratase
MNLASKHCVPCHGGMPALTAAEVAPLAAQLEGWRVEEDRRLKKTYRFADFVGAVAFVDALTPVAEAEDHHPNLAVRWGAVGVTLWTHANDALTENDFILAAKLDRVYEELPVPAPSD